MRWIGNTTLANIITILSLFAMIAGFFAFTGTFPVNTSGTEQSGELVEVVYPFLEKTVEPALIDRTDENKYSNQRVDSLGNCSFLNVTNTYGTICFSLCKTILKDSPIDYYPVIPIKLLI